MYLRFTLIILLLFSSTSVVADDTDSCHRLATDPADPSADYAGVKFEVLDSLRVIRVCSAAIEQHPEDGRLMSSESSAFRGADENS